MTSKWSTNSKAKRFTNSGTILPLLPECIKHWSFPNSAILPSDPYSFETTHLSDFQEISLE